MGQMTRNVSLLLMLACGCTSPQSSNPEASIDGGADVSLDIWLDGPSEPELDARTSDGASDAVVVPGAHPVSGELTIIQLDLPVGAIPQLGEAGVLVGPDGTLVLLDVGNSRHDDDVRNVVRDLNTHWLTPDRGYPRLRRPLEVDWIVLSHFHSDHIGAMQKLMTGNDPIEVTQGIVHRGFVDVGAAVTESDYAEVCTLLTGTWSHLNRPLCTGASGNVCDVGALRNPATGCPALSVGNLADASDDVNGTTSFIDLGGGAQMVLIGADGFVSDGTQLHPMDFGVTDPNEENGRSVIALIRHGGFRYHWAGDLTGSGDPGEPDVESHLIEYARASFYGDLGVDVIHAHHHVRATSSNPAFVEAMAPIDGQSRNVIGGVNEAYVLSPYPDVIERWVSDSRLGDGRLWITDTAAGGGTHPSLIVAMDAVTVQTSNRGAGYAIRGGDSGVLMFSSLR